MLHRPQHTIADDEVHVWHLLTEPAAVPAPLDAFPSFLSPDEQERMKCLRHARDRKLFFWSRVLLRSVLASYLDCAGHEVCFSVNSFGKPILRTHELPLHFNLTHSRGAVALAVSRGSEVGVDVEGRERRVDFLGLAHRYFAATEALHLELLGEDQRADAFFALWTLKEAYVKGIGRGLTFPLDAFAFDLEGNRLIAFRPLADFVACDWRFHQFTLGEHHCGAVAVHGERAKMALRDWALAFRPG